MKIKFITEEGLITAKNNYKIIYDKIIKSNSTQLCDLLNDDNIIRESAIEIDPFDFDMSQNDPVKTDVENIKRVYGHMKGLSESIASDERIWVAFTLSEGINYMRYRWMPKNENDKFDRYFFKKTDNTSKRPLFRNGISRLWWIGYETYDTNRTDPYELTEFVCNKDQDFINQLLDIGFSSNTTISRAVIGALVDAQKSGIIINRDLVRAISQYINLLGGIYILDCLTYDEIYSKVKDKIGF